LDAAAAFSRNEWVGGLSSVMDGRMGLEIKYMQTQRSSQNSQQLKLTCLIISDVYNLSLFICDLLLIDTSMFICT